MALLVTLSMPNTKGIVKAVDMYYNRYKSRLNRLTIESSWKTLIRKYDGKERKDFSAPFDD